MKSWTTEPWMYVQVGAHTTAHSITLDEIVALLKPMSKFILPLLEPRFHLLYEVIKIKGY